MRRKLLLLTAPPLLAFCLLARPAWHLAWVARREAAFRQAPPDTGLNSDDYSRREAAQLKDRIVVPADLPGAIREIRATLKRARREGVHVSIAGARHSQGGHTIAPGGLQLDLSALDQVRYDPPSGVVTLGAGCRWKRVIEALTPYGRSVEVMQSDDNFSVGGSLSVNCHGWQSGKPPIDATVVSITVITADGRIRRCSRSHNGELFRLALGGYGLVGVILEAQLNTLADSRLRFHSETASPGDYGAALQAWSARAGVDRLAYGRLCVAPEHFMSQARLNVFVPLTPCAGEALDPESAFGLKRLIFRGQVESPYGKDLRWRLETAFDSLDEGAESTRNQVQHSDASLYWNLDPERSDVLQEYFVPAAAFAAFTQDLGKAVLATGVDLLNATVRDVKADTDSVLSYAPQDRLALVLFFDERRGQDAEAQMQECTRRLIDAALDLGGSYYLPYRPHATLRQFRRAYPSAAAFLRGKRRFDPHGVFSNEFYDRYLRPPAPAKGP